MKLTVRATGCLLELAGGASARWVIRARRVVKWLDCGVRRRGRRFEMFGTEAGNPRVRSSLLGGTVMVVDGMQHVVDGCFNWLRRELRAGQYRLDPARHGARDLYSFGPMEMTPERAAIVEAALQRAKEHPAHSS